MKKMIFCLLAFGFLFQGYAQENLTYQKPPKEILELVDVPLAPSTLVDSKGEMMVFLYRDQYKSIAELSETELRLGGLRINPVTNISSRANYFNKIEVKPISQASPAAITGLPANPLLSNFSWSPDETKIAMTHTTDKGVELWMVDLKTRQAKRLTEARLNANMGNVINWFKDNSAVIVKMLPKDRKDLINTATAVPQGPTISVSEGSMAQNRTYQDLLQNPNDEYNFEQLARSSLMKVNLNGNATEWKGPAMYTGISFSPDGNYVMVSHLKRPFSYIVPYSRFPTETTIYDKNGKLVNKINDVPLIEEMPQGFMAEREGRRNVSWRNDAPSTLVYVMALDKGDPANEVEFRDEVFLLDAPFKGEGKPILKTRDRYAGITWGNNNTAIAYDRWWNTRNMRTYVFDPSQANKAPKVLFDRNYQDQYSNPGSFVTHKNQFGSNVLTIENNKAYLLGPGYTETGQFPFLDAINLETATTERLYQSNYNDKKESLVEVLDIKEGKLLVRIESSAEYPNYYIRNINNDDDLKQITNFENPFKALENVHKEIITYKRDDGLELNGTLYLPANYDKNSGEKLPMILWAYPREFKDLATAGQNTSNPNDFTYPNYGSPIYWVNRGYVVLDDASFPIVGEGDEEPNDTFREQLVANGKAAIDAVDALGYVDRNRVAVGGHS